MAQNERERDDEHHRAALPDLPPEWGHIVVPDDPRELAVEAADLRTELGLPEPRQPGFNLFRTRRFQRHGLSGPLITLVLTVVAAFASLVVLMLPSAPRSPVRAPLSRSTVIAGAIGGLLPDVTLLDVRGRRIEVRTVRPAVFLIEPPACADCQKVATALIAASRDTRVTVALVADGPVAPALPPGAERGRVLVFADPANDLSEPVVGEPANGPTAVLVRANGVITRIVPNLVDPETLRSELAGLTVN